MRLPALGGAALLAAALALVPAVSYAQSAPARPAGADLAPGMRAALERDLGLSGRAVDVRLAHEAAAPVVEKRARAALGDRFAGAWFDARAGRLTVAVTDRADVAAAEATGARAVVVARGERRLSAAKARLDAARAGRSVHSWYVDPAADTVTIVGDAVAARDFAAAAGVAADAVRVVPSTEAPRPLYDIRGGDQYVINGNTLCSVGFSVNNGGFVTAGHCGGAGSPTLGYNNVAQGTFAGSSFPTNDYAWVRTNGNWTPRPWVNNYAGGNASVAGSAEARDRRVGVPLRAHDRLALRHHPGQERHGQLLQGSWCTGSPRATPARRAATPAAPGSPATRPRALPPAGPATARPAAPRSSSRSTRSSAPTGCR